MDHNKSHSTTVAVIFLLSFQQIVIASNDIVISEMHAAVNSCQALNSEQKIQMCKMISDSMFSVENVGKDKEQNAREHLQVYLNDIVGGNNNLDSEHFDITFTRLRWNFGNYIRMPSISQSDREASKQLLQKTAEALYAFINTTYIDTPEDIRNAMASRAQVAFLEREIPKVGNYFYPHMLYNKKRTVSQEEIIEGLKKYPFLMNNIEKFKVVGDIIADKELAKESKNAQIEFFIFRETCNINDGLRQTYKNIFDIQKIIEQGIYTPPPPSLGEAEQKLVKRLYEESLKKSKERQEKSSHEAFVRSVLEGTGINLVDGTIQMPEELINPKSLKETEPIESAHTTSDTTNLVLNKNPTFNNKSEVANIKVYATKSSPISNVTPILVLVFIVVIGIFAVCVFSKMAKKFRLR